MPARRQSPEERAREAELVLARVRRESGGLFASPLFGASRAADGAGANEEPADTVELWGRRVGRALGAMLLLGLGIYFISLYL
jgi:hypothetical protein